MGTIAELKIQLLHLADDSSFLKLVQIALGVAGLGWGIGSGRILWQFYHSPAYKETGGEGVLFFWCGVVLIVSIVLGYLLAILLLEGRIHRLAKSNA